MTRKSIRRLLCLFVVFFFMVIIVINDDAFALEIPPDRIRDPDGGGLQQIQDCAYNSQKDEYIITYSSEALNTAYAIPLSPEGVHGNQITIFSGPQLIETRIDYNPDRDEYLIVMRGGEPPVLYGRYLNRSGQPIGNTFQISRGWTMRLSYNNVSQRYMLVYQRDKDRMVYFRMIDGNSGSGSPVGSEISLASNALVADVDYGSGSDKYLVVYAHEPQLDADTDIRGRFVSSDGQLIGGAFPIDTGYRSQTSPNVAYSSSNDRWLVTFVDWSTGGFPEINARFVDSNGHVNPRFTISNNPDWDVSGPIVYNEPYGKFIVTWFMGVACRTREVDPVDGSLSPERIISGNIANPLCIVSRPDPIDPQVLVIWRENNGGNGVHAGIMHLPPPADGLVSLAGNIVNRSPDGISVLDLLRIQMDFLLFRMIPALFFQPFRVS